jgi:hypothetical protein
VLPWWEVVFGHGIFARPIRGRGYREKNRLFKLARSGKRIEDPDDARLVRQLIEWELHRPTRRERIIEFVAIVLLVGLIVLMTWFTAAEVWPFVPVPLLIVLFAYFWISPRYRATARANNWEIPGRPKA